MGEGGRGAAGCQGECVHHQGRPLLLHRACLLSSFQRCGKDQRQHPGGRSLWVTQYSSHLAQSLVAHFTHYSLESEGWNTQLLCFFFPLGSFSPFVLLHYYSSTTKNISLCFCVSSRSDSVGGAAAENSRCWLWCHPELQMGWKPSAHTHLVQKGFKHGKKLRAHALQISPLFLHSHYFYSSYILLPCLQKPVCTPRCPSSLLPCYELFLSISLFFLLDLLIT